MKKKDSKSPNKCEVNAWAWGFKEEAAKNLSRRTSTTLREAHRRLNEAASVQKV